MSFTTALDDFGAGYAGLGLLARFQPDLIKIDMELVRGVEASPARRSIVRRILQIAQDLDIIVLAEGGETLAEVQACETRAFGFSKATALHVLKLSSSELPSKISSIPIAA